MQTLFVGVGNSTTHYKLEAALPGYAEELEADGVPKLHIPWPTQYGLSSIKELLSRVS